MLRGCPPRAVGAGVGDGLERIGAAGVLGEAVVVEVGHAGHRVEDHVLEHGAEAGGGRVDLRLGLGREVDRLGVAAALEVEDAVVRPAVLVVADQPRAGRPTGWSCRCPRGRRTRRRRRRRPARGWPSSASATRPGRAAGS